MFDFKKWAKRLGIVFLVLVLLGLMITFMPLMDLATYYLVTLAILMIQIAVSLVLLKVALQLILWAFGRKAIQVPLLIQKINQKLIAKI